MPSSPPNQTLQEKPIEKKILHAGRITAKSHDFIEGTRVKFHFVTKREDEVLDDSRKWDNKVDGPMELVFGKKFKVKLTQLFKIL